MSESVISKYRPSAILKHRTPRGGNQCDFCGAGSISHLYQCTTFNWNGRPIFVKDSGYWASCRLCSSIIDASKWTQLATRVMAEVKRRKALNLLEPTILQAELVQLNRDIVRLYKLFAANRTDAALLVMERAQEQGA